MTKQIERGAAEIRIELSHGDIRIYHGDGALLAERINAPEGTWHKMWEFFQLYLEINPVNDNAYYKSDYGNREKYIEYYSGMGNTALESLIATLNLPVPHLVSGRRYSMISALANWAVENDS